MAYAPHFPQPLGLQYPSRCNDMKVIRTNMSPMMSPRHELALSNYLPALLTACAWKRML